MSIQPYIPLFLQVRCEVSKNILKQGVKLFHFLYLISESSRKEGKHMAISNETLGTKMQLRYEKGSKTFSNCRVDATDEQLYNAALSINSLQNKAVAQIRKIVESELVDA